MPVGLFDNRLPLTLASGIDDITRPLINGLVDVEGIRLNVVSDFPNVHDVFRRMLCLEFDAAYSLSCVPGANHPLPCMAGASRPFPYSAGGRG